MAIICSFNVGYRQLGHLDTDTECILKVWNRTLPILNALTSDSLILVYFQGKEKVGHLVIAATII